jgi:hypothetical protein
VLLAAARQRLDGDAALLTATQTATLPMQLRQMLRQLPPEQPLLLQISDSAPLPLLDARWRAPLKLCQRLLAGRPWAISCRSPALEQLSA